MRWEGDGDLRFVHEPLTWFNSRPALHFTKCIASGPPVRQTASPIRTAALHCIVDRCMRLFPSLRPSVKSNPTDNA